MPPVLFYLPVDDAELAARRKHGMRGVTFGINTVVNWTLQTCVRLRESGFACELTNRVPERGIMLAARPSLPWELVPPPGVLVVCMAADAGGHPYAQLNIVQNRSASGPNAPFMPHWTDPFLVPRAAERGDRFEVAAYVGDPPNLAPELRSAEWAEALRARGLEWRIVADSARMNDYSDIDLIVAARSLGRERGYPNKPGSKLYNAWMAGIPAVLGAESAFQSERRSELDYLEATTVPEFLRAIDRLRDDVGLRRAMVENGVQRRVEVSPEAVVASWRRLIEDVAVPAYERWLGGGSMGRAAYLFRRYAAVRRNGLAARVNRAAKALRAPLA